MAMAAASTPMLNTGTDASSKSNQEALTSVKKETRNDPEIDDATPPKQSGGTLIKCKLPIVVGKRRGGKVLPTGVIKKPKTPQQLSKSGNESTDYLTEVRRYQELTCTEELKRTSLVK